MCVIQKCCFYYRGCTLLENEDRAFVKSRVVTRELRELIHKSLQVQVNHPSELGSYERQCHNERLLWSGYAI